MGLFRTAKQSAAEPEAKVKRENLNNGSDAWNLEEWITHEVNATSAKTAVRVLDDFYQNSVVPTFGPDAVVRIAGGEISEDRTEIVIQALDPQGDHDTDQMELAFYRDVLSPLYNNPRMELNVIRAPSTQGARNWFERSFKIFCKSNDLQDLGSFPARRLPQMSGGDD